MAGGSNIKSAPDALTPVKVEQLLDWMDARRRVPVMNAADLVQIARGHVCQHGVRWPHPCGLCDDAAWAQRGPRLG
ncbi:hypothetical protein [Sphingobium cloacae]|uniref:hypothetical protein n=1 Tax=Sphingobium cloacae TaxID=120107 RepID=UPI00082E5EB6|nr:hypothetical protein [Sphingobium cloacae]